MSRLQDVILRGLAASKPLASSVPVGTLYYSYDSNVVERSSGSAWESYGPTAGSLASAFSSGMQFGGGDTDIGLYSHIPPFPSGLTKDQIKLRIASTDLSNGSDIALLSAYNVWLNRNQWNKSFAFNGTITPSALTGSVNDYSPTGLVDCCVIRASTDGGDYNITGLDAAGASITTGYVIIFINIGASGTITLKNASGSSSAANQFRCASAADATVAPGEAVILHYDYTSSLWEVIKPAAAAGAAQTVKTVTVNLTFAQIRTLSSIPVQILAGQGAAVVAVVLYVMFQVNRTATAYNADPSFRLRYNGDTSNLMGVSPNFFLASVGPDKQFRSLAPAVFNYGGGGFDPRNKAIEISTTADITTGTGTIDFAMGYQLMTGS